MFTEGDIILKKYPYGYDISKIEKDYPKWSNYSGTTFSVTDNGRVLMYSIHTHDSNLSKTEEWLGGDADKFESLLNIQAELKSLFNELESISNPYTNKRLKLNRVRSNQVKYALWYKYGANTSTMYLMKFTFDLWKWKMDKTLYSVSKTLNGYDFEYDSNAYNFEFDEENCVELSEKVYAKYMNVFEGIRNGILNVNINENCMRSNTSKKALYESIMSKVSKVVKKALNESDDTKEIKVGDIFYIEYGYDANCCNFYKVVSRTSKMVTVVEVASKQEYSDTKRGFEDAVPTDRVIGEPKRCRIIDGGFYDFKVDGYYAKRYVGDGVSIWNNH